MVATANTGEIGRGFGKNAGGWTGKVEISKEEIPGSKCSIYTERDRDTKIDRHKDRKSDGDRPPTDRQTDRQTFSHWISFSFETDRQADHLCSLLTAQFHTHTTKK